MMSVIGARYYKIEDMLMDICDQGLINFVRDYF